MKLAQPWRVLLADDHVLVRAGIRTLLDQLSRVTVVAEASDGREALQLAAKHQPDLAIMDIAMPVLNGIDATTRLRRQFPGLRVLVLSMHANEEYVQQAFRAGASGYLLKKSAVAELEAAIRAVQAGDVYLSPALAARITLKSPVTAEPVKSPLEKLTSRQREILQLIAESRTTKEIAGELGVSAKTVEFHRAELMKRLNLRDIPALVRFALQSGLAHPET
jgi:DNA-binding NarL/FixJ family response regulator